jgi:hypothetical protein
MTAPTLPTTPRRPHRAGTKAAVLATWREDLRLRAVGAVVLAGGRITACDLARRLHYTAHGLRRLLEDHPLLAFEHAPDPEAYREALVVVFRAPPPASVQEGA